ncbi:aspartyl protease family protein [Patiriisocius marinus]|nr:aspartyl protease family protein [Patiriisocius marinus]
MDYFNRITALFFCVMMFFFGNFIAISQEGFLLPKGKKVDRFSFKSINNLIVVPIELNGSKLSFLLDTGVDKTVLFGVTQEDSVEIKNAEKIKIRGLGSQESKEALRSFNNTLKLGDAVDVNHTLYVVFDEMIDFSKYMGVPIHGIIGYEYFKNFEVSIQYSASKIVARNFRDIAKKPCRKCDLLPLDFFKNKPYIYLDIEGEKPVSMLIDSGSSDALWLFDSEKHIDETAINYFEDFLGYTLSGAIYGKRSRVSSVVIGKFTFEEVTAAFPEDISYDGIELKEERGGSIGGALLSRFNTTIDYRNKCLVLKRNRKYKKPFDYDLSGLTLMYDGSYRVKELQDVKSEGLSIAFSGKHNSSTSNTTIRIDPLYQLFTAPKVVIAEVREDSAADLAGLKVGDALIKINGSFSYNYELYELNALFRQEVGKKIKIEYERDNELLKTSFKLKRKF